MDANNNTAVIPLISVVIPVYNKSKYIRGCLESVLSSSLCALEVICVDDGSTDGSLGILREYEKKDPRVNVLTQEHLYAGAARNAGIRSARGKYIHFLDADDYITDTCVYEKWSRCAETSEAEICECLYTNIDDVTDKVYSTPDYSFTADPSSLQTVCLENDPETLIYGHVIPWNKLYLRSFLTENDILFDTLICAEDHSFYYDALFKAKKIVRVKDRWIVHRVHVEGSLDGSDIRLRHFEVEFRSFERIWEIAKDAPEEQKRMLLDSCIGDSFYYYGLSIGTEHEKKIRQQLFDYWRTYLPFFKAEDLYNKSWYARYLDIIAGQLPSEYGDVILGLYRRSKKQEKRLQKWNRRVHTILKWLPFLRWFTGR